MAEPDPNSTSAAADPALSAAQEDLSANRIDPALEAILAELWSEAAQQRGALSLARLCKRTGLRMSTLKRFLTALEGSGLVVMSVNARGVECVSLSETLTADLE